MVEINTIYLITLFLFNIILNGIGDALNDSNRKKIGHILRALSILTLLIVPVIMNITIFDVLGYVFLRFGLFDILYNITRKLPLNYSGSSDVVDDLKNKLRIDLFVKFVFLVVGLSVIIRY